MSEELCDKIVALTSAVSGIGREGFNASAVTATNFSLSAENTDVGGHEREILLTTLSMIHRRLDRFPSLLSRRHRRGCGAATRRGSSRKPG